ncbi:hypothetical protein ACFP1I_24885 [Dyadobacter subterraneus]|uniref:Uncharacterized protein n=1 Tax=Dyadobacter subterraneus TaxID=2773304 RepID=A0ABR9WLB7_9BACT|nr:hypothetical protein [Dyadobacter subterraneus]MBE9466317.1 hypothetical protein [Dyadobacter subterraneus]
MVALDCQNFRIVIPASIVGLLSKIEDPVNGLLILHLASLNLIKAEDLDTSRWVQKLNEQYLTDESWLFAYEISLKKWIGTDFTYVNRNPYFKQLRKAKVSFYDESRQIEVVNFSKVQTVETDQEVEYSSVSGTVDVQTQTSTDSNQPVSRLNYQNLGDMLRGFDNMIEGDELDLDYLDY